MYVKVGRYLHTGNNTRCLLPCQICVKLIRQALDHNNSYICSHYSSFANNSLKYILELRRMIPPIVYLPMVHTGYHLPYTNTEPSYITRRTTHHINYIVKSISWCKFSYDIVSKTKPSSGQYIELDNSIIRYIFIQMPFLKIRMVWPSQ